LALNENSLTLEIYISEETNKISREKMNHSRKKEAKITFENQNNLERMSI
jgi:hypothetical protein